MWGLLSYTKTLKVEEGQTINVTAALQVGSEADTVMVTAGRLQGQAEAINIERMSADIVQVLQRESSQAYPTRISLTQLDGCPVFFGERRGAK